MKRIILIGLSGSGKTTVARELAGRIGFDFVDLDDEIVNSFGATIPDIFRSHGEPVFRTVERQCLIRACADADCVIATGGGVVTDERNWITMRPDSLVVHLHATADELARRLQDQLGHQPEAKRPLIEQRDPRESLEKLWGERKDLYSRADVTIDTTGKDCDAVVREIMRMAVASENGMIPIPIESIGVPTGRSDLYVATGLVEHAGHLARQRFPSARRSWIVTDSNVGPRWTPRVQEALASAGFVVESLSVPAGESSKSLDQVSGLLDQLLSGRLDRRDVIISLGGGVVGDLAGFVASVALRGVGLVQIPTSLLAMVDSSVGGKTGVNHPRGKNLIGAFYQPQLVLADPMVLETLPDLEWRGGWAEIVKHGMIESTASDDQFNDLLTTIEQARDADLFDPTFMEGIIRRNVRIKAAVVQQDERESGLRMILNYGHTLGHAMEASGYRYHHGEAVALGMRAAVDIGVRTGHSNQRVAQRQNDLLDRIGLPSRFEGRLSDVIERLGSDKKAVHGKMTWILPGQEAGRVEIVGDVPMAQVEAAAIALGATA